MKYVIGVDNGGTVSKAAVFDLTGREVAVSSKQTPLIIPKPGYTERDMQLLWEVNCECIRTAVEEAGVQSEQIIGLAVGGHGKGLYAWGKNNEPAYNGIVSTDNRAWEYPERWKASGVFEELYPKLCQQLIPCQQAAILAWMKDNDPMVYDNIKWVFSVKDYIRFKMTGEARSEATDISGSGLMNVRDAKFDSDLLSKLGIGEVFDKLAPLCNSYDNCGGLTEEAAEMTGLKPGLPVAGGMFDIDACAIAMDVTSPEHLCTITGTWSINEFISQEPVLGTEIAMNSLFAVPGYYLIEECSATGAGNLEWFIQNFMQNEVIPQGKKLYQHMDDMVELISPAECEVYYLPFLYGSNAHTLAKASFAGLTSYHSKWHMLRSIYEGVVYSHKTHIDKLLSARSKPKAIRMAGGATNSQLWVQMFADILAAPIETVKGVKELGALGCAMAAAVAAGEFSDYKEAANAMVHVSEPVLPNSDTVEIYENKYEKYKAMSDALDQIWHKFIV